MQRIPLVLLLSAVACSSRADAGFPRVSETADDPLATTEWRPASTFQTCEATPPDVASAAALLDSVALADRATSLTESGHVLLTFVFDDNGMPADGRLLETTLPPASAESLLSVARSTMRQQAGAAWARLRVDIAGGEQGSPLRYRMRIGGTQYCPPTLENERDVRLAMGALNRQGTTRVLLYVDQEGVVQEHELVSGSGSQSTDDIALGMVVGLRYSPAYLERLPVPARVLYDVRF